MGSHIGEIYQNICGGLQSYEEVKDGETLNILCWTLSCYLAVNLGLLE